MKGLKGLKEVTGTGFPEHTYFLTGCGEAIYAYYNVTHEYFHVFRKSLKFDKGGRKFEKVVTFDDQRS